jgi:prophage DNA circulation protein
MERFTSGKSGLTASQLHFARPTAYNEIYNAQNKWDKDYEFYRAFDLDEAFFTQTEYLKSKHSRALISNFFSKSAISEMQHLIRGQVRSMYAYVSCLVDFATSWINSVTRSRSKTQLVSDFSLFALPLTRPRTGKSSNLYLGFQCLSADTITNFLFSTCSDQLSFPDFQGDIVTGVDIAMPTVTLAKYSAIVVWMIRYLPPSILMVLAPSMKGLVVFRSVSLN